MAVNVTVVIVSYNVAALLDACLDSIKKGTGLSYEIIVVDNNSKDSSVEMVKKKHPDVVLINNETNAGFAKANNQAFRGAKGRYIFMLNPDTIVLENAIDKLVQFMDTHPAAGACGPKNLNPDGSLQYNCCHFPDIWIRLAWHFHLRRLFPRNRLFGRERMTYWDYGDTRQVDWIAGCSLMIRSEALEQVGLLDENYFMYTEETDLCFQMKKAGWSTLYYPDSAIIHYGGQSSLAQNKEKVYSKSIIKHLLITQYYFFRKNYGLFYSLAVKSADFCYYSLVYVKNIFRTDANMRQFKLEEARNALSIIIKS